MYNCTKYTSLFNKLFDLKISRMTAEDFTEIQKRNNTQGEQMMRRLGNATGLNMIKILLGFVVKRTMDAIKYILPISLAMFRFMEWWGSKDFKPVHVPIPPPIAPINLITNQDTVKVRQGKCSICASTIVNPAMISTGYVFCYSCIHTHLDIAGQCPISGMRVGSVIRKIYL